MIDMVVVLSMFGFAGGYLAGHASLWEGWRERWEAASISHYERYYELLAAGSPLRVRALMYGKFYEAITCQTCAGWHAAWIGAVVWWQEGSLPADSFLEAFVAWLAACGVHTFAMGVYDSLAGPVVEDS